MGISTGGVVVAMLSVKLLLEPGEIILFFKRTSIIITQKMSENNDTSHAITPPTQFSFISQNTLRKECVDVIDI